MKAHWRRMLDESIEEAILAVDLYNQPRQPRRLEGFLVHMHMAWLYILHAGFRRGLVDYHYRLDNGRYDRIDGEPKTWDLRKSVIQRWPEECDVRKNIELTIGLRNKIEHRYHEKIVLATSGYAQALLLNYEEEMTTQFGESYSLGAILRFPIFVGSIVGASSFQVGVLRSELPRNTRDFLATFESDIDPEIARSQRYEFRVNLIQRIGSRTDSDAILSFVRESDLTDEQKIALADLGSSGTVLVRERIRQVSGADHLKPMEVVRAIEARLPFKFNIHHYKLAWQKLGVRPPDGSAHPERTIEKYCIYDQPFRSYLYTQAFVNKVVRECETEETFASFLGRKPVQKV